MKIKRLSLWHQPLTSHQAYYMADGKACDTVETVVLRVDTDSGISGWGEVCPIPHNLPDLRSIWLCNATTGAAGTSAI